MQEPVAQVGPIMRSHRVRSNRLKLPGIRWVFFDVGHTLINEDDAAWDRFLQIRRALKKHGVEVSAEAVKETVEDATAARAPSPVSHAIATLAGSIELGNSLKPCFTWRKELEKPYPGADRVLSALSRRYKIGVIANQSAGTEGRLATWGLSGNISLVVASAETGLAKPDLAIYQLAMEQSGSKAEQSVMIGDRIDNDIEPAKLLGWKTIRVKQGLSRGQEPFDRTQKPDFEVHSLDEILEILL